MKRLLLLVLAVLHFALGGLSWSAMPPLANWLANSWADAGIALTLLSFGAVFILTGCLLATTD